jgi:hypothetical protein
MKMNNLQVGDYFHNSNGKDYKIIAVYEFKENKNGRWACCILKNPSNGEYIVAKHIMKTDEGYARGWAFGYYTSNLEEAKKEFIRYAQLINISE